MFYSVVCRKFVRQFIANGTCQEKWTRPFFSSIGLCIKVKKESHNVDETTGQEASSQEPVKNAHALYAVIV